MSSYIPMWSQQWQKLTALKWSFSSTVIQYTTGKSIFSDIIHKINEFVY